jgi:hypothetical protein
MKKCNKCKLEKMEDDFHRSSLSLDGRRGVCKDCRGSETSLRYKKNKVNMLSYSRDYQKTEVGKVRHNQANARYRIKRESENPFKICTKCKAEKSITEFYLKGKRRSAQCAECRKESYYDSAHKNRQRAYDFYHSNKDKCLESSKLRYRNNIAKRLLSAARTRAKKKGIPFGISENDIIIPKLCPILGLELRVSDNVMSHNSPTLDRTIGELGYIPGNVLVISAKANTIKSNATLEELKRLVTWWDQNNKEM